MALIRASACIPSFHLIWTGDPGAGADQTLTDLQAPSGGEKRCVLTREVFTVGSEGASRPVRIDLGRVRWIVIGLRQRMRMVALTVAASLLAASAPAAAHKDHNALGAGPGPSAAKAQPAPATAPPTKANVATMHENMAMGHEMAAEAHEEAAEESKTLGQRLVSWLGRLHTLVIHFPIAMFVGALGVEIFGLWRRNDRYQSAAHVMLMVGALGAVVAAFLGWFAGGFYLTDRNQILMLHRWLGTAIAVAGFGLLYLSATARRSPEKPRTIYWVALAVMTIAIAIQGYIGGSFMHGGMRHMAF